MGNRIRKPHETKSVIKDYLEQKISVEDLETNECFVISFKHLDKSQGEDLYTWESKQMLAHAIDVLSNYCMKSLRSQFSDKFCLYGGYPPPEKAGYKKPTYVPEDAEWARIHITGTQIVAGHIVKNIFYIVFLDPDHSFWKINLQDR